MVRGCLYPAEPEQALGLEQESHLAVVQSVVSRERQIEDGVFRSLHAVNWFFLGTPEVEKRYREFRQSLQSIVWGYATGW